ncbi:putative saga complex subunit sgf29 protein [Phaeoacremonium minimum UCRPA7]|uniref:Putative saga complex subunit sgf29 protein n=1 Tax=Phaeoacremonium minimum (strain UCR-PA7) TaxID=1286976 RepID=R8BXP7_PHAM7|nr:putative saga complex subunit sgf29 protein [Phaeoacremonium minimum UCRPA7]EOO04176.1 putative saga complex subunit sgf29 protein [Phaeoacremonium minimum UCRPA7]
MSSQRSRNARGPNRNGGGQGEEFALWQQAKDDLKDAVDLINGSNENTRSIVAQDEYMTKNKGTMNVESEERKYEDLMRKGVRNSEQAVAKLQSIRDNLAILRAVQKGKEDAETAAGSAAASSRTGALHSGPGRNASRAGARDREREREKDPASLYDFDGAGDSPIPSPIGGHTRKLGGSSGGTASDRSGNRDSVPPRGGDRDTPAKADSVEPQFPGAGAAQRSKVSFIKGQDVAFKPKPTTANESTDWYLGKVQQVLGEGKSRRYKVKDEDPDIPPEQRQEYRTSASSMIPIPSAGAELSELDKGKTVLALYPDSTTFYKAEVMGTDAATGKVNLRFEGEENSGTLQVVERRFVVEYRN